ncbi:MAG: hypothetical protein Q8R55_02010 [Candidatus Taylorbacteria bacterium]|nr:hypothetical protein [Candidatus Taylorbacteria bacterium]
MSRPAVVTPKIVDYLRSNQAFHDTPGITLNSIKLCPLFGCAQPAISYGIRQLVNSEIIELKSGKMGQGNYKINHHPPHFVLSQGYETGDSWKDKLMPGYQSNTVNPVNPKSKPESARRPRHQLGDLGMAKSYVESLGKLEKALADNNQLREQLVDALKQKGFLEAQVTKLQTEIDDLKASEHQASVELVQANQEIITLTSRVLGEEKRQLRLDRKIANSSR